MGMVRGLVRSSVAERPRVARRVVEQQRRRQLVVGQPQQQKALESQQQHWVSGGFVGRVVALGARAGWIGEVSGGKLSCPSRARRLLNPPLPAPEKPGKIRGDGAWPVSRKAESHASSGACGLREQARSVHNQIEWSNRGSSGSGGEALKG